ncbi:hypothetical protein MB901379_04895 [Mycobacterium basiliense]|uniref:Transglycosylase SLT domain protein n=2 Tax=Mycobacterium basiliense TaxID=2094119 RepID=A0A447GLA0_9MYCO|nr:hypothetical protein MB901379_04895 [Mycobacterium basiliense]
MVQTLAALSRGHSLLSGNVVEAPRIHTFADRTSQATNVVRLPAGPAARSHVAVQAVGRATGTDRTLARLVAVAQADHAHARMATRAILQAAHADLAAADTPLGRRQLMVRMAARLRAQQHHIVTSRSRARRLALRLRRLRYLWTAPPQRSAIAPTGRTAVLAAIQKALDIKGIHGPEARARWTRGMDLVAQRESGYNAHAVNGWDSNAARDTPSKGAWQFIAPTFAAYHQPGTSSDIYDLVAQACAFINYARGHYGVAADASNLAERIQQADPRRAPRGY